MALLIYRSTPFSWCNLSPAESLMGRRLRTNIPIHNNQLKPKWNYLEEFRRKNLVFKNQQIQNFDVRHGVRNLSPLPNGNNVWVTSDPQTIPGKVVSTATTPRSYMIETPTGRVRRNRQQLNPIPENSVNDNSRRNHFVREPIMTRSSLVPRPFPTY